MCYKLFMHVYGSIWSKFQIDLKVSEELFFITRAFALSTDNTDKLIK